MSSLPGQEVVRFEVGRTYSTRMIGDHNCIVSVTIAARTAMTVTTDDGKKFSVKKHWRGAEVLKPLGRYSMSPTIYATDTATLKADWEK